MSLVETRLDALRDNAGIDQWETRARRWGAFDYFRRETTRPGGVVTPELIQKAYNSVGRDLEIPVINFDTGVVVQNVTQPVLITGGPSTSELVLVTFVNYYFGFLIHPAAHRNNEISMQREFEEQIKKYDYALMQALDVACLTALEAAKTQVLNDDLGGRYRFEGDMLVANDSDKEFVMGDLDVVLAEQNAMGDYSVIGNASTQSLVRRYLLEKGQYNTDNKTYQYDNKDWFWTSNLSNAAENQATGFILPNGRVGMLHQFGADSIMGNSTHKHQWGIERLPYSGLEMGTYQYDDAVNASALHGAASAHLTATKVEAYGFHNATAIVTPYNSDPANLAGEILKFAVDKDDIPPA